jgi:tagatose 1,6-diphosphate aldolase
MSSIGKARGLSRLVNPAGQFTMVALDQRPPIAAAIAKARGVGIADVAFAEVVAAKRLLVKALAQDASSMLLDPNFALPAAVDILPSSVGLIVTLEDHRFEETATGRRSKAIADWSVEKIRRIGGDGVKVLAWYRPDASADVVAHQQAFVRAVGEDCARHDIPYILELLVYPFPGAVGHTTDYVEAPDKRAELVLDSVREFAKPEYRVDILKLETPLPAASLGDPADAAAARPAREAFGEMGAICRDAGIPWVMLSGGVAPEHFERVLTYAYGAGAVGFLAGRTIWLNALERHFPDEAAVLAALEADGRQRMARLADLTARLAPRFAPVFDPVTVVAEGDFARAYA